MKKAIRLTGLFTAILCLFFLSSMPFVQATTDHFTDSFVVIMGKCDTVASPALWLFGFKFILNREVVIQATGGQNEKINAFILPSKIGFYFGQKNIVIQLQGAKGLFFRGEKSWLFQNTPQRIFAVCKATDIWVTYELGR